MQDDKTDIILSQWQTCVEMANSINQRRDTMNNIFVTVNLAIIAASSITFDLKSHFILAAGIVLCALWIVFIRNYKLLNTAKFHVIQQLEEKLPEAPFKIEWEELQSSKKYKDGTKLEKALPIMFIILYAVAFIVICVFKTQ